VRANQAWMRRSSDCCLEAMGIARRGSQTIYVDRLDFIPGRLAQLGERRLDKAEVIGSSPISPTGEKPRICGAFLWLSVTDRESYRAHFRRFAHTLPTWLHSSGFDGADKG
jgi:hypothetical protein